MQGSIVARKADEEKYNPQFSKVKDALRRIVENCKGPSEFMLDGQRLRDILMQELGTFTELWTICGKDYRSQLMGPTSPFGPGGPAGPYPGSPMPYGSQPSQSCDADQGSEWEVSSGQSLAD